MSGLVDFMINLFQTAKGQRQENSRLEDEPDQEKQGFEDDEPEQELDPEGEKTLCVFNWSFTTFTVSITANIRY